MNSSFDSHFSALTGNAPFPWQGALFERLIGDDASTRFPSTCDIPTGLGKTSVIAVWLLALAQHARTGSARTFPRRLVYVVNRRTVVDQSTREAEMLRENLVAKPELREIAQSLRELAARPTEFPLAISTLRGQFVDNADWRDDPARPAVIIGTVDMIGSRLLFNGYGRGFKARPLHAAFLGQDALLVHDEAHLEPAFQSLVESVHAEQQRNEWERGRFHVMALSATARTHDEVFRLSAQDHENDTIKERLDAAKALLFCDVSEDKQIPEKIAEIARQDRFKKSGKAILVFLRQVKDVLDVKAKLQKDNQRVETLTGTLRGYERDALVLNNPVFARFMPRPGVPVAEGTVYLICTSAGEVGVNISADHLLCDLTPLDSMTQRFGRVHRFGRPREHVARIEIVASSADAKDDLGARSKRARQILERLPERPDGDGRSASPAALSKVLRSLSDEDRCAAFSPQPTILPVTDMLLDAWALTSIRKPLPGRPPVADYLHGVSDFEPPQTLVAWRSEVQRLTGDVLNVHTPADLLEDFPLKPHELLQDRTDRIVLQLLKIAERQSDAPVWLVDFDGSVRTSTLSQLTAIQDKKRLEASFAGCTVLLPPSAGGLLDGLLDGEEAFSDQQAYDVADKWLDEDDIQRRGRTDGDIPRGMRIIRAIDLSETPEVQDDADDERRTWSWYVQPKFADDDGSKTARAKELLTDHLGKAGRHAAAMADKLVRPEEARAIALAAKYHDLGKNRRVWQRSIGNLKDEVLAKSGPGMKPREITGYRHEFGSLIDVATSPELAALNHEQRELVLHAIASHHGRARPHFPFEEAFDPERPTSQAAEIARAVTRRFAELQVRYGRWGLAYLESLVRAADALASQEIGAVDEVNEAAE